MAADGCGRNKTVFRSMDSVTQFKSSFMVLGLAVCLGVGVPLITLAFFQPGERRIGNENVRGRNTGYPPDYGPSHRHKKQYLLATT